MEKILVAGATGTTGKQIINILNNNENFEPFAMIRKESQKQQFESQGVRTIMGDLTRDISDVTEGMDKVIFAAGSKGKALQEVDLNGARKIVDAGKRHKIKKFAMLSSLGADAPESDGDMQEYLQAKNDADEYLANSGLDYTIVRPGSLNNETPTGKIRLDAQLSDKNGEIPRGDVARVLVQSLHDNIAYRDVFEILNGEDQITEALENMHTVEA